jgi:hypothetical protein
MSGTGSYISIDDTSNSSISFCFVLLCGDFLAVIYVSGVGSAGLTLVGFIVYEFQSLTVRIVASVGIGVRLFMIDTDADNCRKPSRRTHTMIESVRTW